MLAWTALALWLFVPGFFHWPSFRGTDDAVGDAALVDVTPLFHIPGVTVQLEKVGKGDTYASLAQRLRVSEAALRSLNQSNDASEPSPEVPLWVPSKDGVFHWVVAGQGWVSLAKAYGVPLRDLLAANQRAYASAPQSGEVLFIPGGAYLDQKDPRWKALQKLRTDAGFQKPTTGGRFADGFGMREHPITHKQVMHEGLDLAPGVGCKVVASQKGIVAFAGNRAGYGHLIILDHGGGLASYYAHLSEIRVKAGERVAKGDWIGRVGATGNVTGPHLHFEIRKNGKPQNPLLYLEK